MRLIDIEKLKGCAIVRPHTHEDIMSVESSSEKIAHKDIQTAFDINTVMEHLKKELELADDEKCRCIKENPMQFDEAKGYARGIATAIEIVKGGVADAKDANVPGKWIPCSERLPEKPVFGEDYYLIQAQYVEQPFTAYWDGCKWTDDTDTCIISVIAWMPLPEPYRGE